MKKFSPYAIQRKCRTSLRDRMKDGLHTLFELQTNALRRDLCLDEKYTKIGYYHKTAYKQVTMSQQDQGLLVETFLKRKVVVGQPT